MTRNVAVLRFKKSAPKPTAPDELTKPKIDQFLEIENHKKYSDAIWYCILEIIERDIALLGKYHEQYDQKLIAKINQTQSLIISLRRHGVIGSNQNASDRLKELLRKSQN